MATNSQRWVENLQGASKELRMLGKFQAGATKAIKRGEILELTGGSSTWVPIDSDFTMDSNVCIAGEEIKSGDRAGYYEIIVPRPGDVFEFDLAAAGANAVGVALYYSSSEVVSITAGSNIIGYTVAQFHYPARQGKLSDDASGDAGTTIRTVSQCHFCFTLAASYWSAFQAV